MGGTIDLSGQFIGPGGNSSGCYPSTSFNYYTCTKCGVYVTDYFGAHICMPQNGTISVPSLTYVLAPTEPKPYKCPCCDGWGKRKQHSEGAGMQDVKCPRVMAVSFGVVESKERTRYEYPYGY